jgi:alpha-beta hydrolase superfamily lysophospholipase
MANAASPASVPVPQSRFAESSGVRLHYLIAGEGDPVVLLHGYAQTSRMWRPLIAELAETRTVIAPDLRGFGHWLMEEAADRVIPKLVEFLAHHQTHERNQRHAK